MGKRKSNDNIIGVLAFFALLVAGVCAILNVIGIGGALFGFLGQIALTIVVLVEAWSYARTCSKTWRIIYYVLAILVIVGLVFGGISL